MAPIDWKLPLRWGGDEPNGAAGHHSLVTPIDWKPSKKTLENTTLGQSHHSLATPIDWKPPKGVGGLYSKPSWSPLTGDTY